MSLKGTCARYAGQQRGAPHAPQSFICPLLSLCLPPARRCTIIDARIETEQRRAQSGFALHHLHTRRSSFAAAASPVDLHHPSPCSAARLGLRNCGRRRRFPPPPCGGREKRERARKLLLPEPSLATSHRHQRCHTSSPPRADSASNHLDRSWSFNCPRQRLRT